MRRLPAAIYLHLKTAKLHRLLPPFCYGEYPLCEPLDKIAVSKNRNYQKRSSKCSHAGPSSCCLYQQLLVVR